jgi:hypothetical protein
VYLNSEVKLCNTKIKVSIQENVQAGTRSPRYPKGERGKRERKERWMQLR